MEKDKGNISVGTVIGWGVMIAIASFGFTMAMVGKVTDAQTVQVQRISVLETESKQYKEDIKNINEKLDEILKQLK